MKKLSEYELSVYDQLVRIDAGIITLVAMQVESKKAKRGLFKKYRAFIEGLNKENNGQKRL